MGTDCQKCEDHETLMVKVAVIENTVGNVDKIISAAIKDVQDHVKTGQNWRLGIIGLGGLFLIQSLILATMWGQLCKTVEINSGRITLMETLHPRGPYETK